MYYESKLYRYTVKFFFHSIMSIFRNFFFFFNYSATPEIFPLSLPDALPISCFSRAKTTLFARVCEAVSVVAAESADRKSTRLNSSHSQISYAVFCLKKKKEKT